MSYTNNVTDTLWADVSEFQVPVTDAYLDAGYKVLSVRSSDGTYRDHNWSTNYAWCQANADSGALALFIVYCVYRPDWQSTLNTLKAQVGTPHPKMVVMLDVESWGGQIGGDNSDRINRLWWGVSDWLGTPGVASPRVIGYANVGDFNTLWPTRPPGLRMVVAGYGNNPSIPGKIAHQYTNGTGFGARAGLPDGAPPWPNCDMNSADGLSVTALADILGVGTPATPTPPTPQPSTWMGLPTDDSIFTAAADLGLQFD